MCQHNRRAEKCALCKMRESLSVAEDRILQFEKEDAELQTPARLTFVSKVRNDDLLQQIKEICAWGRRACRASERAGRAPGHLLVDALLDKLDNLIAQQEIGRQ